MIFMHIARGSAIATIVAAAGLLVVLAGCTPAATPESLPAPAPTVTVQPSELNTESLSLLSQTTTPPTRVTLAQLDIDMAVEPHGLDSVGDMSLPVSPFTAGWYAFGSAPDSIQGSTVIAAHVDSLAEGVGPFSRLRDAQPGMTLMVTDEGGVVHNYVVTALERIPKAEVPLARVFTGVGDPHLVLVTCGGEWDRREGTYIHNYIVTAEKVS
jgi:hypothetical protein